MEYQLGKHGLYPEIGGTLNQPAYSHKSNKKGKELFFDKGIVLDKKILQKIYWLMHFADGFNSEILLFEKK